MKFATFSIVAHDPAENAWGVAVASKFLAVGAYVPYAQANAGAIATQAYGNMRYGPAGLALLANGASAQETLQHLLAEDGGREERQAGIVDAHGSAATHTGSACMNWAGGITGTGYAIQGNILAGGHVIQNMQTAFEQTHGELAKRLYAALLAGDQSGGDKRGKQAAALLVVKPNGGYLGMNDRYLDLRVDDHREPVAELGHLLKLHQLYFGKTAPADKFKLTPNLVQALQQFAQRAGAYAGLVDGVLTPEITQMLNNFIGAENLEERIDLANGTIDPPALEYLQNRFG